VLAIPSLQGRLGSRDRDHALEAPGLPAALRDALVETLYASGSDLLILPIQDVFGWRDRINQPAGIDASNSASNWTWRLPWLVDRISEELESATAMAKLKKWTRRHTR
jgi:4-alpha-glucanotransferase